MLMGEVNVEEDQLESYFEDHGVIAIGLYLLHRERNDEAIFFLTALVLAPAAVLSVYHARFLEVRYFFVLLPFVWLLAARALGYALSCPAGRVIVPALVTASVLGNGVHVVTMLRDGRGHYARAVSTMSVLTSGQEIVVASDQDFSNRLILDYYGENISPQQRLTYVSAASDGSRAPQWFITHTFDTPAAMPPTLVTTPAGETIAGTVVSRTVACRAATGSCTGGTCGRRCEQSRVRRPWRSRARSGRSLGRGTRGQISIFRFASRN